MRRRGASNAQRAARTSWFVLLAVLVAVWAPAAPAQDERRAANEARAPPETLVLWNRPVTTFRATVFGVEPEQRVRNARRRIESLTERERLGPVASQAGTLAGQDGFILNVGGQAVFGLVPGDIDPESGLTLAQAVERSEAQLRAVLDAQASQRRVSVVLRGVGLALAASVLLILAIYLIRAGRDLGVRALDTFLRSWPLAIGGIDIAPTLATVERATLRVVSWALIFSVTYLWLVYVLQQFPYTVPLGTRLGSNVRDSLVDMGQSLVRALPRLALVVAVLLITRAVSLWVSRLLAEVEHGIRTIRWQTEDQARATRRIAVGVLWIFGIATAYLLLPWAKLAVFQGMSVVLGLALSIASTGLLNQWISGLVLIYSRSFKVGDFVSVGGVEGFVTEMGPLATKLRTMRREEVTVPNAVVTAGRLTNFTRLGTQDGSLLSLSISLGYDVPWQQAEALLMGAAARTKGVRRDPPPRVLQWELSDFSVSYQLHVSLETPEERAAVRSALNSRILDAFAAAGVQIMTPHFESQPRKRVVTPTIETRVE